MKKTVLTIALTISFLLPIAGISTVNADPHYGIKFDTKLWQHSFASGHVRCHIKDGDRVYRHWGGNWSRWIYVKHLRYDYNKRKFVESGCRGWFDKKGHISYYG